MPDSTIRVSETCEGSTATEAVARAKEVSRQVDTLFSETYMETFSVSRVDIEEDEDVKWVCKFYREGVA